MYELTVERSFSAAHCIPEHLGKCARLHGHTYRAVITVAGEQIGGQGMLMDFADLKARCDEVVSVLDHQHLNALPEFAEIVPSAEALARFIYEQVRAALSQEPVRVARVSVYESVDACATYWEQES